MSTAVTSRRKNNGKSEMSMAQLMTMKILSMYDRTTDSDAIVQDLYHPDASFSDPWVEVHGRENVAAHFRAIPSVVAKSHAAMIRGSMAGVTVLTIDRYIRSTSWTPITPHACSNVTFRFKPFPSYLGCTFRMFSVLELQDHQIIKHTDHWDLNTVLESIPVVSFCYRVFRTAFGHASSHLINTFIPRTPRPQSIQDSAAAGFGEAVPAAKNPSKGS
ncbi:hypothetical protein H310_07415 [Aphanomyces invadans]|uniref:SnoaL-like domain-containing protein n=1 Tax=Aphanomyces invadans TaxID=157072 RepID=A0A024U0N2_9STRA|nr:hypothetical protein H310_07415 [Aphanomyces invadans]ETV99960.1 hypothetical protein H310_07415 [Aphanomyces invadans]|eukprot:XP_008871379.1 hypothetical protein H310_07415 [Aphanomyces invadans]